MCALVDLWVRLCPTVLYTCILTRCLYSHKLSLVLYMQYCKIGCFSYVAIFLYHMSPSTQSDNLLYNKSLISTATTNPILVYLYFSIVYFFHFWYSIIVYVAFLYALYMYTIWKYQPYMTTPNTQRKRDNGQHPPSTWNRVTLYAPDLYVGYQSYSSYYLLGQII